MIGDRWGVCDDEILLSLPEPKAGANYSTAFGRPVGTIVSVTSGKQLTGRIAGATMSYVLIPEGSATRLLLKVVIARGRLIAPLVCLGDLVMARRQLLNLKRLAERT